MKFICIIITIYLHYKCIIIVIYLQYHIAVRLNDHYFWCNFCVLSNHSFIHEIIYWHIFKLSLLVIVALKKLCSIKIWNNWNVFLLLDEAELIYKSIKVNIRIFYFHTNNSLLQSHNFEYYRWMNDSIVKIYN